MQEFVVSIPCCVLAFRHYAPPYILRASVFQTESKAGSTSRFHPRCLCIGTAALFPTSGDETSTMTIDRETTYWCNQDLLTWNAKRHGCLILTEKTERNNTQTNYLLLMWRKWPKHHHRLTLRHDISKTDETNKFMSERRLFLSKEKSLSQGWVQNTHFDQATMNSDNDDGIGWAVSSLSPSAIKSRGRFHPVLSAKVDKTSIALSVFVSFIIWWVGTHCPSGID